MIIKVNVYFMRFKLFEGLRVIFLLFVVVNMNELFFFYVRSFVLYSFS